MVNPFNNASLLYPFRWFVLIAIAVGSLLLYADLTGWRLFSFGGQQQWSATGPRQHK